MTSLHINAIIMILHKIVLILFILLSSCNGNISSSSSNNNSNNNRHYKANNNKTILQHSTKEKIKIKTHHVNRKTEIEDEVLSATLLHESVLVNGRLDTHVVSEVVSFAVLTVRFNNNIYVSSPSSNKNNNNNYKKDVRDSGWEEQDLDTLLGSNYYPENHDDMNSEFGLTELNCHNSHTNTFHTFNSYPDDETINTDNNNTEEIVNIPKNMLLPRSDLNSYPWVEAFLQSTTLIGMEKGHVGSKNIFDKDISGLNDAIGMDMGTQDNKKYQAVIFDPIFDTDDLDLNNIQCNLTFVEPSKQTWLPKKVFVNRETKKPLKTKVTRLTLLPLDFNNVDTDKENDEEQKHHPLIRISNHIEDNIDTISSVVLRSYDKEDSEELSEKDCVKLPEELLSHSGVVALLQTGVKEMHTDVDDELPALMLPILQLILMPITKLLSSLFGHRVVEKMHNSGGFQIREGLIKDVAEDVSARVINGVSRMVVPGLMQSVPDAVSESIMSIIQTYLIEDLSPSTERAFATKMGEMLQPTVYKDIAPEASRILTERASRSVTHSLTRSLAHSIVPALSHTITHSPLQDYYCFFCYHHKVYCGFCNYSPTQLYYSLYYAGFYSSYFGDYYSEYFSKPEEFGFLAPDKESDNIRDGHDPYLLEDDPNLQGAGATQPKIEDQPL